MIYTDDQQTAISHRAGNLLILACAGSGKTEVISRRIASLVMEGTPKSAIIAFTFTERAADELKNRIRRHLDELIPDDPALGDMYVGTIHSFCLQILREIDPHYRKFEVMDEIRQAALIMTQFTRFQDGERGLGLDRLRHKTRSGGYWDTVRTFLSTLNVLHQMGLSVEDIEYSDLREAVQRYRRIVYDHPNYFFDFNYIIDALIQRLEDDPAELAKLRSRFRYLVVDEYQDVDGRQEALISLITNVGKDIYLTVVGDDDQAIYGWRGARIENILSFSGKYPNVKEVKLQHNFRSTHGIAEIANAAIRHIPQGRRIPKNMEARHWANDPTKGDLLRETLSEPGDIQVRTFTSDEDEAEWIAQRILELRGSLIGERDGQLRGLDYADMAILLRSVKTSGQIFASTLRHKGIPAIVRGVGGLFDHDEVLVVQAAFSLLARQAFSFRNGEGYTRLDEVDTRDFIRAKISFLTERGLFKNAHGGLFLEWIARKREELDRRNLERSERKRLSRRIYPQDIFHEMLEALGAGAGPEPWPQEVLFNLGKLSYLITQFEAVHQWVTPKDLPSLCLFLGGWAASAVDEGGADEITTPNAIQILTVHAAKGLEWPVVFLPRISSSNFPSSLRKRGPETFLPRAMFNPDDYAMGDEGERRLWYVALTRCRKFLHVSSPDRYRKKPTEFLREIKHDSVQRSGDAPSRSKGTPTPPANVDLLPTTHTALSYFWRCPFEYQLRELMGFGPGVKESYGYGQQIHNLLAEIHRLILAGTPLTTLDIDALVERRFHLRYTRDGDRYKPLTTLREAAKRSIERYLETCGPHQNLVLAAEKPFEFLDKDSGALISGTIDLLERIEHTNLGERRVPVAVVEFKTHSFRSKESFDRIKDQVENQLRLYSVAVKKALGFEAGKGKAHFLSPKPLPPDLAEQGVQESFEVDVSASYQEEIRASVRGAVQEIRTCVSRQNFGLDGVNSGSCRNCDYRVFCPGHTLWKERDQTSPRLGTPEVERGEEIFLTLEDLDARPES